MSEEFIRSAVGDFERWLRSHLAPSAPSDPTDFEAAMAEAQRRADEAEAGITVHTNAPDAVAPVEAPAETVEAPAEAPAEAPTEEASPITVSHETAAEPSTSAEAPAPDAPTVEALQAENEALREQLKNAGQAPSFSVPTGTVPGNFAIPTEGQTEEPTVTVTHE